MTEKCKWTLDEFEGECYDTACGKSFVMLEGTPEENDVKYCCYCGKEIEVVMTQNDFLNARW